MHVHTEGPISLRRALQIDAGATAAMGVLLLAAAGPLAALLGIPAPMLRWAGGVLIPFAGVLAWAASRPRIPRGVTWALVEGNATWVLGSVLLVASGWLTPTPLGVAFVLAQAGAVALFAYLEYDGLRRAGAAGTQRAA